MAKTRVIIDTDPGCDDILALLLALTSSPEDLEVLVISVTYGNVDVQNCLRNVVSMFNVIEKDMTWRRSQGLPEGFEMLKKRKPTVAVGAEGPLGGSVLMADYYHGVDGLGNVHHTHPHHTSPTETWKHLFDSPPEDTLLSSTAIHAAHTEHMFSTTLFEPSSRPSHKEILRILEDNPPDTITLIAIGPLTNLALAAAESPTIFMKAKEVVVMGGTISEPGNITPVGEFNCIADATAAARLYALTSPNPASTMPPDTNQNDLPANLKKEELGERRLRITMFPLDITTAHTVSRVQVEEKTKPLIKMGSPLAEWVGAFMAATFRKSESLYLEKEGLGGGASFMCLHDIVCIWYASASSNDLSGWQIKEGEDIRVETQGQWTTSMCVVDKRHMKMLEIDNDDGEVEVSGDTGNWLQKEKGNRLGRCVGTPGAEKLAPLMLTAIFG